MLKFLKPVKDCVITSTFNMPRKYPLAPKRKQAHEGIDFAPYYFNRYLPYDVVAAKDGVVIKVAYSEQGYGNFVVVAHDARYITWYCHLQDVYVKEKEVLSVGQKLGLMGSTGNSTGKHLHFNLQDLVLGEDNYVVPKVVNPLPFLVDKIDTIDNITKQVYNVIVKILH